MHQPEKTDALTRQSGDLPQGEGDSRRQYQWQTILKPENVDIQAQVPSESPLKLRTLLLAPISSPEPSDSASEGAQSSPEPEPEDNDPEDEIVAIDDAITQTYTTNKYTQEVLQALRSGAQKLKGFPLAECAIANDRVIFRGHRTFIPEDEPLRLRILQIAHDSPSAGHPGKTKMFELVSRCYYWPGLMNDVKCFTWNCRSCRRNKPSRDRYHGQLKPNEVTDRRWSHLSMDFIINFPLSLDYWSKPCTNSLVITDRLSKI